MDVKFYNIQDECIKAAFLEVMERYEVLHDFEIVLSQGKISSSTMQAQPVIKLSSLFSKISTYKVKLAVYVRDSENIKVSELPPKVLVGWFAHELGHIVDYTKHSAIGMVWYGLKYLMNKKFKRKCEHAADQIAIDHNFHDEIIITKEFILGHELLGESYKNIIKRYYMSLDDVRMCVADKDKAIPKTEI